MNFFFIEPLYTFTVAEPHELLSLLIFLVVSIIAATLAGRVREQVRLGAQRVRALRRLYEFTRKLSSLATVDKVAEAAAGEINTSLARPAVVLLDHGGELVLRAAWPPVDDLDAGAMTAARWAFTHDEAAGADTATLRRCPGTSCRCARHAAASAWSASPGPRRRIGSTRRPWPCWAPLRSRPLRPWNAPPLRGRWLPRVPPPRRSACATRCWLPSRTISGRRCPRSWARPPASRLRRQARTRGAEGPARPDQAGGRSAGRHGSQPAGHYAHRCRRLELRKDWIDVHEIVSRVVSAARRQRPATRQHRRRLPGRCPWSAPTRRWWSRR